MITRGGGGAIARPKVQNSKGLSENAKGNQFNAKLYEIMYTEW